MLLRGGATRADLPLIGGHAFEFLFRVGKSGLRQGQLFLKRLVPTTCTRCLLLHGWGRSRRLSVSASCFYKFHLDSQICCHSAHLCGHCAFRLRAQRLRQQVKSFVYCSFQVVFDLLSVLLYQPFHSTHTVLVESISHCEQLASHHGLNIERYSIHLRLV